MIQIILVDDCTGEERSDKPIFRDRIQTLKEEYERLRKGRKSLLTLIDEANNKSTSTLINAAHRQSISAFREKSTWKIEEA